VAVVVAVMGARSQILAMFPFSNAISGRIEPETAPVEKRMLEKVDLEGQFSTGDLLLLPSVRPLPKTKQVKGVC